MVAYDFFNVLSLWEITFTEEHRVVFPSGNSIPFDISYFGVAGWE